MTVKNKFHGLQENTQIVEKTQKSSKNNGSDRQKKTYQLRTNFQIIFFWPLLSKFVDLIYSKLIFFCCTVNRCEGIRRIRRFVHSADIIALANTIVCIGHGSANRCTKLLHSIPTLFMSGAMVAMTVNTVFYFIHLKNTLGAY